MSLKTIVAEHGGIACVLTHPIGHEGNWANTILCFDGWSKQLTLAEEQELAELPADYKALHHIIADED